MTQAVLRAAHERADLSRTGTSMRSNQRAQRGWYPRSTTGCKSGPTSASLGAVRYSNDSSQSRRHWWP